MGNTHFRSEHGRRPALSFLKHQLTNPNTKTTPQNKPTRQPHSHLTASISTRLLIAMNVVLMQCDGNTIRLAPAWPKNWKASFKLHAPKNTTVEGRVENGKVSDLKVTPETRRKDVVIGDEFK